MSVWQLHQLNPAACSRSSLCRQCGKTSAIQRALKAGQTQKRMLSVLHLQLRWRCGHRPQISDTPTSGECLQALPTVVGTHVRCLDYMHCLSFASRTACRPNGDSYMLSCCFVLPAASLRLVPLQPLSHRCLPLATAAASGNRNHATNSYRMRHARRQRENGRRLRNCCVGRITICT